MGFKFAAEPGQIESRVDLPHHVNFGNGIAKAKLVEQLTFVTLQTAHHGSTSPRIASTQRNHGSRAVSTVSCNKIGLQPTPTLVTRDHQHAQKDSSKWVTQSLRASLVGKLGSDSLAYRGALSRCGAGPVDSQHSRV